MSSSKSKVSSPAGVTSLSGMALLSLLARDAAICNRILISTQAAAADQNPGLELFYPELEASMIASMLNEQVLEMN